MRRTEQLPRRFTGGASRPASVEASADSGGPDLPALAGSAIGGFVRPAPGPGFGAARPTRCWTCWRCCTRYWDFHGQVTSGRKTGGRARGHAQLQLAVVTTLAGAIKPAPRRGAHRRKAAAPAGALGMMLHQDLQPMGGGRDVGPGGDLGTMRPARSTRACSSPRKAL